MAVNKVILVGNVGKDPDVKYFDNDSVKASFPLATSERGYTTANGTQVPERTEWHNIVMWRGLAEIAEKFVKKGSQLYIEGKIQSRTWDDKNGVKHYATEILCENMQMLSKKSEAESGNAPLNDKSVSTKAEETPFGNSDNIADDDLPF